MKVVVVTRDGERIFGELSRTRNVVGFRDENDEGPLSLADRVGTENGLELYLERRPKT